MNPQRFIGFIAVTSASNHFHISEVGGFAVSIALKTFFCSLLTLSLPQRMEKARKKICCKATITKESWYKFLSNMSVFYHEEPPNPNRRCRFLTSALKDAFSNCHNFGCQRSTSSPEKEYPASESDEEQDVVVSVIRSRVMEAKLRRKAGFTSDSFSCIFYPTTDDLIVTPKAVVQQKEENEDEDEDEGRDDFFSVRSCFSLCSSAASREAYLSVKTHFSRCSSLNGLDFQDFWRRSIIQEFYYCEGWPFGLCRKAVLLPPLPKSPSESWLWRKGSRIIKMP